MKHQYLEERELLMKEADAVAEKPNL